MLSNVKSGEKNELFIDHKGSKLPLPPGSRVIQKPDGSYIIGFLASELQKVF